jgi:DNA invertase Pin-like site-specific DNA recombinase
MTMNSEAHQKVTAAHLSRMAYLYVRQSTLRQVLENTESTHRQYALRERALALGWPLDRIVVIDNDLGQSGASAADREGFQRLVTEVSLGRVGIVLGLEVSRLARNSTDWHRLLELCALADTLILDEDGLYDPAHFNDRLLLGLKGTMSEAELHVLKARLRGGILSRARRGELKQMVPAGFVHDAQDRTVLDPDAQVQGAVRLFFETFKRTGSCLAVVKEFHAKGLLFPRRLRSGAHKGELVWAERLHCRARQIIHNPHFAGAFVFGRQWQNMLASSSQRGMDSAPRYASGLHYLGRVPVESQAH